MSSPGAYAFGFAIKLFLSNMAGPLDENLYIENTSLLKEPIVKTFGNTPGNDIVPYDGPSFPEEEVINILLLAAILINSIIFSSL